MDLKSVLKKVKTYDILDDQRVVLEEYVGVPTIQRKDNVWSDYGIKECTDFALACGCYQNLLNTLADLSSQFWVRNNSPYPHIQGDTEPTRVGYITNIAGVAPVIRIAIKDSVSDKFKSSISYVKDRTKKSIVKSLLKSLTTIDTGEPYEDGDTPDPELIKAYIGVGAYPTTAVSGLELEKLELLYNNGDLCNGLRPTDRYYVSNAYISENSTPNSNKFFHRLNPEFELIDENGLKHYYVRGINLSECGVEFESSRSNGKQRPMWFKVTPVEYEITNWHKLPKFINCHGKGTANTLELESSNIIISPMPFNHMHSLDMDLAWQEGIVSAYLNGLNNSQIKEFVGLDGVYDAGNDFSQTGGFLGESLYRDILIKDFRIPEHELEVGEFAFSGCVGLSSVTMHKNVVYIGKNAFDDCSFKYAYRVNDNGEPGDFVLSTRLPIDKNITNIVDLDEIKKTYTAIKYDYLREPEYLEKLDSVTNVLLRENVKLPMNFAYHMAEIEGFENFDSDVTFKFFRKELKEEIDYISRLPDNEQFAFYAIAYALGCFSNHLFDYSSDKKVTLAQKACGLLHNLLSKKIINLDDVSSVYMGDPLIGRSEWELVPPTIFSKDLCQFLGEAHNGKSLDGAKLLMKLEATNPCTFRFCLENFDLVKENRCKVDSYGNPRVVTWKEAILSAMGNSSIYAGVNSFNEDIAKAFYKAEIPQEDFQQATSLRMDMYREKVPAHLIGKPLRQTTVLEEINAIRSQVGVDLEEIRKQCAEFSRNFSFEWLDKYDARNFISGIFASCCCVISSGVYGSYIAKYSAVAKDLQNVIIKDRDGLEVGKATMYINPEENYAVINEFDINHRYRRHEDEMVSGLYNVPEDHKHELVRNEIYETFRKAVMCFVEEYNLQNPVEPIIYVTVGVGSNKLKRQCSKLPKVSALHVPTEYFFLDASNDQVLFYKSDGKTAQAYRKFLDSPDCDIRYTDLNKEEM